MRLADWGAFFGGQWKVQEKIPVLIDPKEKNLLVFYKKKRSDIPVTAKIYPFPFKKSGGIAKYLDLFHRFTRIFFPPASANTR